MNQEIIDMLKKYAEEYQPRLDDEDFCAFDYTGSNVDDAIETGLDAGYTALARNLLDKLDIEYIVEER